MVSAGDSFLMPRFSGGYDHLWVILLEPEESGKTIMVNVTSKKPHSKDLTTILNEEDHPFITHESVVYYADAREVDANKIEGLVKIGMATKREACSSELLKRIQKGVLISVFTPCKVKDYLRERIQDQSDIS